MGVKHKDRSVKFEDAPLSKRNRDDDDDNDDVSDSEEDENMSVDGDYDTKKGVDVDVELKDVPEKDETERKLEKLLFGDEDGFFGALREQQERGTRDLVLKSDGESAGEDEDEEGDDEKGLDDVADADVRGPRSL